MKKTMIILVVAVAVCVSPVFGTGSTQGGVSVGTTMDPNVTPAGEFPIVKEQVVVTVGLPQHPFVTDYDNNEFTIWLEEMSGIDIQFMIFPTSGADERVRVLVAGGGDLPDVISGINWPDGDLINFGRDGVAVPLNGYIEEYGYYVNDMFETAPEVRALITMPDGEIYSLPRYLPARATNQKAWINVGWLEALGLDMPTTTEEFYDVMMAFKTQDPNGNGVADEIPILGSTSDFRGPVSDWLINAFIYNDVVGHNSRPDGTSDRFVVENGQIGVAYNQEAFRDALRYLNRLTEEGLMDTQSWTIDLATQQTIVQSEDVVGVFTHGWLGGVIGGANYETTQYDLLLPLQGPDGVRYTTVYPGLPTHRWIITSSCENPAAAFRLGDLMLSLDAYNSKHGKEGVDWRRGRPGETDVFGRPATFEILSDRPGIVWNQPHAVHWAEQNPLFGPSEWQDGGRVWDGSFSVSSFEVGRMNQQAGFVPDEYVIKMIYTADELQKIKDVEKSIQLYVNESIARFVIGELDIERDWNKYLAELDRMGIDDYLEVVRGAWARMQAN